MTKWAILGVLLFSCASLKLWAAPVVGSFAGTRGVSIAYEKSELENERGAIVIVNGRSESFAKYDDLVAELNALGYSVYAYDHRGQGFSGRMTKNPQVGYVENFHNYVVDLKKFIDTVVNTRAHQKRFLLAHSMGGAVATLYVRAHPDAVNAMVLSAPMFQINTGKYTEAQAYLIAKAAVLAGAGKSFAKGQGPYNADARFEDNRLTHDEKRFARQRQTLLEHPELILGGPSYRWVQESLEATVKIRNSAEKIKIPVLLLQAGFDEVVRPEAEDSFCEKTPACTIMTFYGSYHEILMEKDPIRALALTNIGAFLAKQ